jgi:hypothetical protein
VNLFFEGQDLTDLLENKELHTLQIIVYAILFIYQQLFKFVDGTENEYHKYE